MDLTESETRGLGKILWGYQNLKILEHFVESPSTKRERGKSRSVQLILFDEPREGPF
jgi:hypothetical protein